MHPAEVLFCSVPVAPLRAEPSHRSEQVSQALWGESMHVLGQESTWFHVKLSVDGYLGWISERQVIAPGGTVPESCLQVNSDWALLKTPDHGKSFILSMGSILRPFLGPPGGELLQGTAALLPSETQNPALVLERGLAWLGTPYLWGGRSRFGVDCSGLVQVLWGSVGVPLPRDASEQYQKAPFQFETDDPAAWQVGNLAFFSEDSDRITHVGLLTGDGHLLHASGEVRLDPVNPAGIASRTTGTSFHHRLVSLAAYHTPRS